MKALEMVLLIMLALIVGAMFASVLFRGARQDAQYWEGEAKAWEEQVKDELTRP